MNNEPILKIAVNVPLSKQFDYLPPSGVPAPEPGCRVLVPFGKQRPVGLVLAHADRSKLPSEKIRRVLTVLDEATTRLRTICRRCQSRTPFCKMR